MKIKIVFFLVFSFFNVLGQKQLSDSDFERALKYHYLKNQFDDIDKLVKSEPKFNALNYLNSLDANTKFKTDLKNLKSAYEIDSNINTALENINSEVKNEEIESHQEFIDTAKSDFIKPKEITKESGFSYLSIGICIGLLATLLGAILYYRNKFKGSGKLKNVKLESQEFNENKVNNEILTVFKEDTVSMNEKKIMNEAKPTKAPIIIEKPEVVEKNVIEVPEIFYVEIPNIDSFFEENDLNKTISEKTIYKITVLKDKITFEFVNNKYSLNRARNFKDDYLKPYCEFNSDKDFGEKIITKKKGVLIKDGDVLRVTQKAIIHYE